MSGALYCSCLGLFMKHRFSAIRPRRRIVLLVFRGSSHNGVVDAKLFGGRMSFFFFFFVFWSVLWEQVQHISEPTIAIFVLLALRCYLCSALNVVHWNVLTFLQSVGFSRCRVTLNVWRLQHVHCSQVIMFTELCYSKVKKRDFQPCCRTAVMIA